MVFCTVCYNHRVDKLYKSNMIKVYHFIKITKIANVIKNVSKKFIIIFLRVYN